MTLAALIDSPAQLRSAAGNMGFGTRVDGSCEEDLRRIAQISPAAALPTKIGQDPDRVLFVRFPDASRWRI